MSSASETVVLNVAEIRENKTWPVAVLIVLLWARIGIDVLSSILVLLIAGNEADTAMTLVVLAIVAPIVVTLTLLISRGYGWVRHLWSALYLLHILSIQGSLKILLTGPWVLRACGIAGELLIAVALVLAYSPSARVWFHDMRIARRSRP